MSFKLVLVPVLTAFANVVEPFLTVIVADLEEEYAALLRVILVTLEIGVEKLIINEPAEEEAPAFKPIPVFPE